MRTRSHVIVGAALFAVGVSVWAADTAGKTTLYSKPGSKMKIEGTSSVHDWRTENKLITGTIEVGPGFPLEPGQEVKPGKVDVKGEAEIRVKGFRSLKENGEPYSDAMDDRMYEAMKSEQYPKIVFHVRDLELKEAPKSKDAPYLFESKGDLTVAGFTNKVSFPVNVLPMPDKRIKISGSTKLKMTDYKIEPPSPKIPGLSMIKTADEVSLSFDWMVAPRNPPAAAASK